MCRIAGFIKPGKRLGADAEKMLMRMRDSMEHGGPDDAGAYVDHEAGIGLGHRRLSLLDPSPAGHQPMGDESGQVWIAYNGEVYNFVELRDRLKADGYSFNSGTDTEVVLKAYLAWGEEAFSLLEGMFAFCIYDRRRGALLLVRDHAGIKPLYYGFDGETFLFASEIRSFISYKSSWRRSDSWQIAFLAFGHIAEPDTILDGVKMLPKGSVLTFDLRSGANEIRRYVEIKCEPSEIGLPEAIDSLRSLWSKSVERHLTSDAPLGVFLSGGLDSSLIAVTASEFLGSKLKTLSVDFDEEGYSESYYQGLVQQAISSDHDALVVREREFIDNIPSIFRAMDQPTIDGVNSYFISRFAKRSGLKAVLSGIGSDELFGGYPSFKWAGVLDNFLGWSVGARGVFKIFESLRSERLKKLGFLSFPGGASGYLLRRALFSPSTVARLLNADKAEVIKTYERHVAYQEDGTPPRTAISNLELSLYMQNQLLRDTDSMGMWNSVEVRVPFLDIRLMRFVLSLDEGVRFGKGGAKQLLKRSFGDKIPKEILHREKRGFSFPFDLWLRRNLSELKDMIKLDSNSASIGLVNDFSKGRLHWSRFWSLIVLSNFADRRI